MYILKPGIKKDPVRRWNLPDRIFFAHGACHILAGVFLRQLESDGIHALWIKPNGNHPGHHIFVTNGDLAFDFHGYSKQDRLIEHHAKGWAEKYPGWSATTQIVDFPLLDTQSLNSRKMLGLDQYLFDPIPRAVKFIGRFKQRFPVRAARACG